MRYTHFVVAVNRFDLLDKALESIEPLWDCTIVIDNSEDGHLDKQIDYPVEVMRPEVRLSCAQVMNFMQHYANEACMDIWGYQHNDAAMRPGQAEVFIGEVKKAASSRVKWATVLTMNFKPNGEKGYWDIVSAYNMTAVQDIGEWDWRFPDPNYHIDCDWFYRAKMKGYELICSPAEVDHLENGSQTRQYPDLVPYYEAKATFNDEYYIRKWGGPPHAEKFTKAFNKIPA